MPEMNTGNEVDSPETADSTPLPRKVAGVGDPFPSVTTQPLPDSNQATPEAVLQWIMTAQPEPWFPSAHASKTGIPRNDLDEPLNELRLAGLACANPRADYQSARMKQRFTKRTRSDRKT